MSHVPHQIAEEFPDKLDLIHELKHTDPHFNVVVAKYDEVNHKVHLAESNIKPIDDIEMIELRKERMALKDEIASLLKPVQA